jgi:hypothetical protein
MAPPPVALRWLVVDDRDLFDASSGVWISTFSGASAPRARDAGLLAR